ncbi:DNA cytosine methyltransferase [Stenotrophomonas rhizophila]|uniref:DNA (cytosine-5-)-methyltransferase n=1 Tax=Stenotrophomonas rhizophila TaxID=216778 RepID=UPI00201D115E|nr:DNA (cytosine-5-)-methyltransferase [Stenotrophomonas rhizophila]UQY88138.1 DNA cytosine methyltransferase [Stenotrophomonas rhizophila]
MKNGFTFIDLFAGLGGFHLAAKKLGGSCVFASELRPELRDIYFKNHATIAHGDINSVSAEAIPAHDLLCAGFPCQPFSKAGSQLGWRDAVRGTLFFKIVEILEHRRPEFVVLENVANFFKHDEGNTFAAVVTALDALGYDTSASKLSPHNFGVPQMRERMYLVGRLRSSGGLNGFQWPANQPHTLLSIRSVLDQNPSGARLLSQKHRDVIRVWQDFLELVPAEAKLPHFPIWSCEAGASYPVDQGPLDSMRLCDLLKFRGSYGQKIVGSRKTAALDCVPIYARSGDFPKWKQDFILQNREFFKEHRKYLGPWLKVVREFDHSFQKFEWNCQGEIRDLYQHILQFRASGIRVKRASMAPALVAMTTSQVPIVPWEHRYMTPRECARLQSMEELAFLPETVNGAVKALGNAVNVEVVTHVLQALISLRYQQKTASAGPRSRSVAIPVLS